MKKDVDRASTESEGGEGKEGGKGKINNSTSSFLLVSKIFRFTDLLKSANLSSLFSLAFPHESTAGGWEVEEEEEEGGR